MQGYVFSLPPLIEELRVAHQALVNHFASTGLKFTLDGRLVGDIGEAIALEYFAIERPKSRTKGVDAIVSTTGQTVQVKTTGQERAGPAFGRGNAVADLLLFFRLDMLSGTAIVLYNGPEAPIRRSLPSSPNAGTISARLSAVLEAGRQLQRDQPQMRVPLRAGIDERHAV